MVRAVPEIIRGGTIFFRPLHSQDIHGVRGPRPPGHVSALINLPHYGSNTSWPPAQDKLPPHSPPLGHIVNKTPSTHRTKKCLRPPQDNFWNSPNGLETLVKFIAQGKYRDTKLDGNQVVGPPTCMTMQNLTLFIFLSLKHGWRNMSD